MKLMNATQRAKLFWGVCIPLRSAIACYALKGRRAWLQWAALVIGGRWVLGFENGDEGVFGGAAWWAEERPVHGGMWLLYAGTGNGMWLVADTAYGACNWFQAHTKTR